MTSLPAAVSSPATTPPPAPEPTTTTSQLSVVSAVAKGGPVGLGGWGGGGRATNSTRLDERKLETVRIGDHEHAVAPGHVLRLLVEVAAARLDFGGELVEVLRGVTPDARPDAFLPVAALREVVLVQHECDGAGVDLASRERAVVAPLIPDHETQHVAIERHAALQIARRESRRQLAQAQRFRLATRAKTAFLCRHGLAPKTRGSQSVANRRASRQIPGSFHTLTGAF